MERDEILKKINEILKSVLDDNNINITYDTKACDVKGWDSLSHISIISSIEDEFKITFSASQVMNFKNVGDIVDVIINRI